MTTPTWYEEDECAHGCASLDETYAHIERAIDDVGWSVMSVMGDERHRPWAYTIGLMETFGHPEFVITGLDSEVAHELLNILGTHVECGSVYEADPGGSRDVHGLPARFVAVHQGHWRTDRFNAWLGYYEEVGRDPGSPEALQVLWPDRKDRLPNDPGGEYLQVDQPLLIRPPAWAN